MERFEADIQAILSHRHDNGADFWATPDGRLLKGSPFTTLESACMLFELGVHGLECSFWHCPQIEYLLLHLATHNLGIIWY